MSAYLAVFETVAAQRSVNAEVLHGTEEVFLNVLAVVPLLTLRLVRSVAAVENPITHLARFQAVGFVRTQDQSLVALIDASEAFGFVVGIRAVFDPIAAGLLGDAGGRVGAQEVFPAGDLRAVGFIGLIGAIGEAVAP